MKRKKTGRLDDENNQYRYRTYSAHFVCFACRKMFNQVHRNHWNDWRGPANAPPKKSYPCPDCKAEMSNIGKDFQPPRRRNIQQWRKAELLFQHGYRYQQHWESRKITEGKWKSWSEYVTISDGPQAHTLREAKQDYPPRLQAEFETR